MPPRPKSACIPRPVQLSMCRSIEQVPEINELEKLQLRVRQLVYMSLTLLMHPN